MPEHRKSVEHNRAQTYMLHSYNIEINMIMPEVAVCEILVACTIDRVQMSDAYSETDVK